MALPAAAIAAIAGAAASTNNSMLNTGANMWSARISRDNANEQAQINREFQERLSSTAFQRQRKDLEAAGLNPALMYGLSGSSTPAGSANTSTALGQSNLKTDYNSLTQPFLQQEAEHSARDLQTQRDESKMDRLIRRAELAEAHQDSLYDMLDGVQSAMKASTYFSKEAEQYHNMGAKDAALDSSQFASAYRNMSGDMLKTIAERYKSVDNFAKYIKEERKPKSWLTRNIPNK